MMLLTFSSSLYFIASSSLASLNVGFWDRQTFASFWFESSILSAALCSLWTWKWPQVVHTEFSITYAQYLHPVVSHLLAAPDDVIDLVFVLQQLSQLSGPQSTKLHRQRHDDSGCSLLHQSLVLMRPDEGAMWAANAAFKDCRKTARRQ